MKLKYCFSLICALVLSLQITAAEKLAIAEPINKGGMPTKDIEALWSMLEASVDGGYELISRAALKAMMTEIGLTNSSGLVNLNDAQKAKLGQIKTVKYLLVPTVSKFGSRLNISMVLVDSSTGVIDPRKKTSETVESLDDLADRLKDMLQQMDLGRPVRKWGKSALLFPIIKVPGAPGYLGEDFNVYLESTLLENGVKLQNLQSVARILQKNKIDKLNEVDPAMFVRVGELLRVDYLVRVTINRFSVTSTQEYIAVTRQTILRRIGNIEGNVRIISAQTGEVTASIPFYQQVDFNQYPGSMSWGAEDYGKTLISAALSDVAGKVLVKIK